MTDSTDYLGLCRILSSHLPLTVVAADRTHVTIEFDSDPAWPAVWTAEDFVALTEGTI